MYMTTTQVLDLLRQKPGRYVETYMGEYAIKESDGTDVTATEGGVTFPIRPAKSQIDQLVEAGHLIRDGSKLRPK